MKQAGNPNGRLTGAYEELREKYKKLIDLGFKEKRIIDMANPSSYNAVYDWLKRGRNLNHENARKLEEAYGEICRTIREALD